MKTLTSDKLDDDEGRAQERDEESTEICGDCDGSGVVEKNGRVYLCACQERKRAQERRKYSGLPHFTPHELLPVTREYIAHYSELRKSPTNWLAYFGRSGSGKSTQAFMVVDALLRRRAPVYARVYYYPELIRELSALRYDYARYETRLDELMEPELVVFDDFLDVVPKPESFEEHVVITLIKMRYQLRKPLIITAEITPDALRRFMPRHFEAILGRIYEMTQNKYIRISTANAPNYRLPNN